MSVSSVSAGQALNALHQLSSDMEKLKASPMSQQDWSNVASTAALAASATAADSPSADRLAQRAAAAQIRADDRAAEQSDASTQLKTVATYLADHPNDQALRSSASQFGEQLKQTLDADVNACKLVEAKVGYGTPQPGENGSLDQTPLQKIAMQQTVDVAGRQNDAYEAVGALNLDPYSIDHKTFNSQADYFIAQLKANGDKAKLAQTLQEEQAAENDFNKAKSALNDMQNKLETDEGYAGERDPLGVGPTKSAAIEEGSWAHDEKIKIGQALVLDTDTFSSASGA